ncbi:hypothetical protein HMPREF0127_01295 [Bacteroides sp. 1_1_30]|nr:hypothetical protein HMPREF0127_01295 [Bacteroides sp. 1_1_30]MCS3024753.1 hypothetical protein [Bacteroides xylanisolvens]
MLQKVVSEKCMMLLFLFVIVPSYDTLLRQSMKSNDDDFCRSTDTDW